jgi:hypothetical protein
MRDTFVKTVFPVALRAMFGRDALDSIRKIIHYLCMLNSTLTLQQIINVAYPALESNLEVY